MNEKFKNLPSIPDFPDDDKRRVVWAFGALYKNDSFASDMPLVEVLLIEIGVNDKGWEFLSTKHKTPKVALPQLDSVRIGNIFIGKKRIERNWKQFMGYEERVSFNFDFSKIEPESLPFKAKRDDGSYYIDPDIFSFGAMAGYRADRARFLNAKLTKLIDENGITVLIPSLEVLTNMIVPKEQEIRSKLVMSPMDDIVSYYLKNYSHDASDNKYIFEIKMGKDLSNMAFLAYLAMNQISRSRISKIRSSVAIGDPLDAKYLEVLPYHPTNLFIISDGIWINQSTFLCFRLEHVMPPEDYRFQRIKISPKQQKQPDENKDANDNVPQQPQQEYDEDDLDAVRDQNPNANNRRYNIHSEVEVGDISHLFDEIVIESDKNISDYFESLEDQEKELLQLSSAENVHTNDSRETGKLAQKEDLISSPKDRVMNSDIFKKVIMSLDHIRKKPNSLLQDFTYVHEDGSNRSEGYLFSFLCPETKYRQAGSWAYKIHNIKDKTFIPRAALIIKVSLTNGQYAYILEIERKNKSESFSGLIFNTSEGNLSPNRVRSLLVEITGNSGSYHYYQKGENPRAKKQILIKSVPLYEIYYHREDSNEKKLYTNVFDKIFNKASHSNVFM